MDIERLLEWAFIDELSKRATSAAEGIWDHLEEYAQRGGIDVGHGAAQRYAHFGLPHPDALKIEVAVSSLPDLIIDWKASGEAIMGELLPLLNARDVLLVRTLRTSALVAMHAIKGRRPDWRDDPPVPHWVGADRGVNRPKVVGNCEAKDRYSTGSYCPLKWDPSPITIAAARAEYACWHRGLVLLSETLDLEEHQALPPQAPAQPWLGESEPPRRVHGVGDRANTSPLPLKPSRGVARRFAPKKQTAPE
jgi:hypothetical protein